MITKFDILPSYAEGFTFLWEVSGACSDPAPWTFYVEQAQGPGGPWAALSPAVTGIYGWEAPTGLRVNQDAILYYRVRLVTPSKEYVSAYRSPYGDLDRRPYLISREVIRKEQLHARTMAGTEAALHLVNTFGPRCTKCLDPITKNVRDANCSSCAGTGRDPAYNGPYHQWCIFTPVTRATDLNPSGVGMSEPRQFQVRIAGAPPLKTRDIIIDMRSDKRYYISQAVPVSEMQRIPLIQDCSVTEAPTSDIAYTLSK